MSDSQKHSQKQLDMAIDLYEAVKIEYFRRVQSGAAPQELRPWLACLAEAASMVAECAEQMRGALARDPAPPERNLP